ncbi:MAG: hypothetical protein M0Z87_12485 [Actinomycetota bacterium]|nr:hypothetical protein [Actinomycetota bacterium]
MTTRVIRRYGRPNRPGSVPGSFLRAGRADPGNPAAGGSRFRLVDQAGQAMLVVIALVLVLMLISAAVVADTTGELSLSGGAVQYHAALAAADAGVSDYLSRLDQNHNYWANPNGNPALTGWVPVPGSGSNNESFTYTANTSGTNSTGTIDLTVTGRSGTTTRTIQVLVRQNSFLDYAYFSIYELPDPTDTNIFPSGQSASVTNHCVYEENAANPTSGGVGPDWNWTNGQAICSYLYWSTGNVVNGPAGSDGNFFICGSPVFNGKVTSAAMTPAPGGGTYPGWVPINDPSLGNAQGYCGGSDPSFAGVPYSRGGAVKPGPYLGMPRTDATLSQEAAAGGCLYTGETSITFDAPSSPGGAGTMTVSSPNSTVGNSPGNTLPSCVGTNVPLPGNGVVFVQSGSSSCHQPGRDQAGQATNPSGQHYQTMGDFSGSPAPCSGNLFEQGVVGGQVTTAAANNVYITGSLCNPTDSACVAGRQDPGNTTLTGNDVLGIIAQNFVYLYGPVCSRKDVKHGVDCNRPKNVTVDGAILDVSHALTVQHLSHAGVLGQFAVNGTMAEKFGDLTAVGSGARIARGYSTTVNTYDSRLSVLTPPYFLDPIAASWRVTHFAQVGTPSSLPAYP